MTDGGVPDYTYTVEIYSSAKALGGHYFWRMRAKNGNIVADSAESYHNKDDLIDVVTRMNSVPWLIVGV
jgi:uncharacterized protein YegP (UPF0339 family)